MSLTTIAFKSPPFFPFKNANFFSLFVIKAININLKGTNCISLTVELIMYLEVKCKYIKIWRKIQFFGLSVKIIGLYQKGGAWMHTWFLKSLIAKILENFELFIKIELLILGGFFAYWNVFFTLYFPWFSFVTFYENYLEINWLASMLLR